jgi:hypothetical protein
MKIGRYWFIALLATPQGCQSADSISSDLQDDGAMYSSGGSGYDDANGQLVPYASGGHGYNYGHEPVVIEREPADDDDVQLGPPNVPPAMSSVIDPYLQWIQSDGQTSSTLTRIWERQTESEEVGRYPLGWGYGFDDGE